MQATVVYGITNCDTVKRARAWLEAQGVAYTFHDLKRSGMPATQLQRWLQQVGRDKLVNRQGLTWRRLDDTERARAQSDATVQALLMEQSSLIKRPVVEWTDGTVTVGFDESAWRLRSVRVSETKIT